MSMPQFGTPAPWFQVRSPINPRFQFNTIAGRYVVLCFFGSAENAASRQVLEGILRHRMLFDDEHISFFGVSTDPEDERLGRVRELLPGIHLFWDFDGAVSRLYGAASSQDAEGETLQHRPVTVVMDERLRVIASIPWDDQPEQHIGRLINLLASLPALEPTRPASDSAPLLVVPRVFEKDLCRILIQYYESHGGAESGFMRQIDGKTVLVHDYGHKRRSDQNIDDPELRNACMVRIHDRLAPEIQKAFQFRATRIERYIVACYDGTTGGHFRPHRDNTTSGTAHRRFAESINLNTGEYAGGDLRFPEFGRQTYCPPAGGAVVFSCSLLHEATPVIQGRRYAFLPFLYDDEAAKIREQNLKFIAGSNPPRSGANE